MNQALVRHAMFVAMAVIPVGVRAQAARTAKMDFGVAVGGGAGGDYRERPVLGIQGLFAIPLDATRGSRIAGLQGGWLGNPASNDKCEIIPGPETRCRLSFPRFAFVGPFVGAEGGAASGATGRVLAGVSYVHGTRDDVSGNTIGLQGRVDGGVHIAGPLALVLSVNGMLMPRFRGDMLSLAWVGLGLRLATER
jgi:hypothetical protein